jgi:hypothetical protein
MEPGGAPVKMEGRESVRRVGAFWVMGEATGTMPDGQSATMIMTCGYDGRTESYVGSWIGSMMSHMWMYKGWIEGENKLVLEAEGPRFDDPTKSTRYRDITEFKTADHRAFHSQVLGEDGTWTQIMSMDFYRIK